MNNMDRILNQIRNDEYAREVIGGGQELNGKALDNLRESLREIEWYKAGMANPAFRDIYRRDMSDQEIYEEGKARKIRMDADESLFFQRQLEEIDSRRFEVKYKPLDAWRQYLPIKSFTPGVKYITYRMYDTTGEAVISSPGAAGDVPMANAQGAEYSNKVIALKLGYFYTSQELRNAAFANVPLTTEQLRAVDRGYRQKLLKLVMTGDDDLGLEGFLNHTNVPNTAAAAAAAGANATEWDGADKTIDEIIVDIGSMATAIRTSTLEEFGQEGMMLGLPRTQFDIIAQTPRNTYSDTTILEFILKEKKAFGIKDVIVIPDLAGAGTGSSDMAIMWPYNNEVIEAYALDAPMWMPMQIKGLSFTFNSEMEFGGVVIRYSDAMYQLYDI